MLKGHSRAHVFFLLQQETSDSLPLRFFPKYKIHLAPKRPPHLEWLGVLDF